MATSKREEALNERDHGTERPTDRCGSETTRTEVEKPVTAAHVITMRSDCNKLSKTPTKIAKLLAVGAVMRLWGGWRWQTTKLSRVRLHLSRAASVGVTSGSNL